MELDKLTVSLGHTKVLYGLMYTHTHTHNLMYPMVSEKVLHVVGEIAGP